jgi:large subunit ribosomal protein L18
MAKSSNYHVPFRRRREGKTNYHRRKGLLQSEKPRLVVRRSNKHARVSLYEALYTGDIAIIDAFSKHLEDYDWKGATGNIPAAYLTGYLAAKYAQAMGEDEAILDLGINNTRQGTRIMAMLYGAVEGGLGIEHNPSVFPPKERCQGEHIAEYAKQLKKEDKDEYKKQFSKYLKQKAKPEDLPKYFEATIKAIDKEFESGDMKDKLKERQKKNKSSKKTKRSSKKKK